ncbi:MAG: HAMP domain-containing sensor histidine kinase [Solirubrobacteraceae bacterium]
MESGGGGRRYLPLLHRVAGTNALLLIAAVAVTIVVLAPRKLSSFAADEGVVLVAALSLVVLLNVYLLRRVVGPLQALTALARRVDLAKPGARMPGAEPTSEAGELALTFNEMLERLEAERREATGRVLAGQEAERLRIAQELHDQVGQELTAVLLGLARVQSHAEPRLRDEVLEVQDAVRASLEDVRRIALELRPEALDDLGLISALAVLCERFSERSGLEVSQRIAEHLPQLDPDTELVLYRVAQEALTNVARHSGVDRAELTLEAEPADRAVTLTVSDRGAGLPAGHEPGTGMRGMAERAALVSARLEIGGGPAGIGCVVRLEVSGAGEEQRR